LHPFSSLDDRTELVTMGDLLPGAGDRNDARCNYEEREKRLASAACR
jgi:hypothetical protein